MQAASNPNPSLGVRLSRILDEVGLSPQQRLEFLALKEQEARRTQDFLTLRAIKEYRALHSTPTPPKDSA
jgi:hypothetical protein